MVEAHAMISKIHGEYAGSPHMLSKAVEYLGKQLPDALRAFAEREERKDRLEKGSEEYRLFIKHAYAFKMAMDMKEECEQRL